MAPLTTGLRTLTVNEGTLQFASGAAVPSSGLVTLALGDIGTLDANGQSLSFGGLSGTGTISNSGSAATLTVNTGLSQSTSFNGLISGNVNLVKSGVGTLILQAPINLNGAPFSNTFTGSNGTVINAGQITTANAVVRKLPPKSMMKDVVFAIEKGKPLNVDKLMHYLAAQGYHRNGKAMEPGEFAVRGGIIDIMPAGLTVGDASAGVRIDLFGNDIESIRQYDPMTQLTQGTQTKLILYPMSEVLLNDTTIEHFRERYRDLFGAVHKDDPLYEAISVQHSYTGMEHWLPLFYPHMETLFDYCNDTLVTLDSESQTAIDERFESILDYFEARTNALKATSTKNSFASGSIYNPVPPDQAFIMEKPWNEMLATRTSVLFSTFTETSDTLNVIQLGYRPCIRFTQGQADRTPFDQLKSRLEGAAIKGKGIIIACFTSGSRERMQT